MSFNNLTTTSGGITSSIHGGFTLSTDGTTNSLTGTSLYYASGADSAQLSNFNISGTTDSAGTETMDVSLTLSSTTINGVITVTTDSMDPLVQDAFEDHPHAGTLNVVSGNTTLIMQILSSTQVSLSVDANNDGVIDEGPTTVNWTDIDSAGGGFGIDLGTGGGDGSVGGGGSGATYGTDTHGDTIGTATTVALPSTTSAGMNTNTDADFFRIDVSATGILTVYTTSSLDTYGYLYDSGGVQLAANDDAGAGVNFSISYNVSPGTYYVRVDELFGDVGAYNFVTEFTP